MTVNRLAAPRLIRLLGAAAMLCGALAGQAALAQQDDVDEISQPVVQPIPGGKGMKLNDALGRLARNPQDVEALIGAGRASMEIGDLDAAVGFFQRADRLSPGNAQVKAGLAGAYAQSEDPFAAIPLFAEAEKAGTIDPALVVDRGLAYDLVGDNAAAQSYYRTALAAGPNEEALRRLAVSQAIAGDRRAMEVTLSPLLQRQDKAAWRARAFGLAILGQTDEAQSIARSNLPPALADSMSGYLRYMPRLTAAQQAAAANLGHFPRAADIGRDDPRVAAFQPRRPVLAAAAVPAAAPAAKGGKDSRRGHRDKPVAEPAVHHPVQAAATLPPSAFVIDKAPVALAANAAPAAAPRSYAAAPAPVAAPDKPAASPPAPAAHPAAVAVPASPPPATPGFATLGSAAAPVAPGFDLKPSAPAHASAPAPAPAPAAPAPPPSARARSLADVFADLTPPSREAEPVAGAVDIRRIATASEKPVKDARGAKEAKDAKLALADACEPEAPPAKGAKSAKGAKGAKGAKAAQPAKGGKGASAKTCPVDAKLAKGKSPAASQPSRIWVQIATGRAKSALAFDWRRMVKENPEILGKYKPSTAAWGANNRLLIGPVDSESAANALIARLKKAGLGGSFVWTSPAGQVVDPLSTIK